MWKSTRGISKLFPQCHSTSRLLIRGLTSKIEPLKTRALIKVSGADAGPFLQGLMTNDIRHLEEEQNKSMFCMFLNVQGRILYDALVYKGFATEEFLVEVDSGCSAALAKHLLMYRIRRKIAVSLEESLKTWVFREEPPKSLLEDGQTVISQDPRTKEMGWRVVRAREFPIEVGESLNNVNRIYYDILRYKLGIGEGINDIPPGTSFPLECNCDYLHGVSFHKGCYIGQELTARTYHTGVTRKRLMPISFHSPVPDALDLPFGTQVSSSGNNVGKLRGLASDKVHGLGMLRIHQVLAATDLRIKGNPVTTHQPTWWPIEAPKDRHQLEKN